MHASICKVILFLLLAATLTSCTAFMAAPTATPTATATSTATSTPTITPTRTAIPATETPTEVILPLPSGTPMAVWEGIPVMSGALAGNGDSSGYTFTTRVTTDDVQAFYQNKMAQLGWNTLAAGTSPTGTIMLIFMGEKGTVSVMITPHPSGVTYVMLVKSP